MATGNIDPNHIEPNLNQSQRKLGKTTYLQTFNLLQRKLLAESVGDVDCEYL